MKRLISIAIIFFMVLNLAGCAGLQKKFTRKKKAPVKKPRIYQVKKYEKRPTPELYKKHYAYWRAWQGELISVIGQNHKKDTRCIEEIISNLADMQNMLTSEKAEGLTPHINNLVKVKDIILNEELSQYNKDYVKRTLEKEDRAIRRDYIFDKIKGYLRISFEDEDQKN